MAAVHMRHQNCGGAEVTSVELFHWQRMTTAFNKAINAPITHSHKDAIFGTAVILHIVIFAKISTTSPQKSWPVVQSEDDLQWISVHKGIKLLEPLTEPWRPESIFAAAVQAIESRDPKFHDQRPGTDGLPRRICDLYDIDASSTVESNPYHSAIRFLVPLIRLQRPRTCVSKYIHFIKNLRPDFVALLHQRDHRALLVLALYYSLILPVKQWHWIPRATTEGQAICMFLERECKDPRIRCFLGICARACGYQLKHPVPISEGLPVAHLMPCKVM